MRSHIGGLALAALAACTTETGTSSSSLSPNAVAVVTWRDVDGAPVRVMSYDELERRFLILDDHDQIWRYDHFTNAFSAVSPGTNPDGSHDGSGVILWFASADCTGPAYIWPLPSRSTVGTPLHPDLVRVVTDDIAFETITVQSAQQGVACEEQPPHDQLVQRFDDLPLAHPPTGLGTPPYHPVTAIVNSHP